MNGVHHTPKNSRTIAVSSDVVSLFFGGGFTFQQGIQWAYSKSGRRGERGYKKNAQSVSKLTKNIVWSIKSGNGQMVDSMKDEIKETSSNCSRS